MPELSKLFADEDYDVREAAAGARVKRGEVAAPGRRAMPPREVLVGALASLASGQRSKTERR